MDSWAKPITSEEDTVFLPFTLGLLDWHRKRKALAVA
jgi:hypothetical protein